MHPVGHHLAQHHPAFPRHRAQRAALARAGQRVLPTERNHRQKEGAVMSLRSIPQLKSRGKPRWPARIVLALAAILALTGLGTAAYAASPHSPATRGRVVNVTATAPDARHSGWQGDFTYDVPAGISGLFFHYSCSTGHAITGAFRLPGADPSEDTINLVNNSPIQATSPQFSQWGWSFTWSGGTAPSGSEITFDVYCS
jgi:hypothetical protein